MSHDRPRLLLVLLLLYLVGRGTQPFFSYVPPLVIVVLHVVPPALFALFHGARTYGWRGILGFTGLCLGVSSFFETLSLRTGFPFGHYHFTDLMGPKVFELPVLLSLAYVGMGYVSWIVAVSIIDSHDKNPSRNALFYAPLVASFVMTGWDFSMDAVWADIYHAWVWHDGGPYFGVPISNFVGWLLTTYIFYQAFALYVGNRKMSRVSLSHRSIAIAFYAISATGNLLVIAPASMQGVFVDATGKTWMVTNILWASRAVSLLIMMPFSLIAYTRATKRKCREAIALEAAAE